MSLFIVDLVEDGRIRHCEKDDDGGKRLRSARD
jgi:hypothetical protein